MNRRAGTGTKVVLGGAGVAAAVGWFGNAAEARASIEWAFTFLLRLVDQGPINLGVCALAVLAGWLTTLRVGMLPMRCLSPTASALVAQIAGTAICFSVFWWLWRDAIGIIVGGVVSLALPYTWSLVLIVLEVSPWTWTQRWAAELRGEGRQLRLFSDRP